MFSAIEIEKVVRSPDVNKCAGIHARFCAIDENWGVKFFDDECTRDDNYDAQDQFHSLGLAPRLGPKVQFEWDDEPYWGFITERVFVFSEECADWNGIVHNGSYYHDSGKYNTQYTNQCTNIESMSSRKFIQHNPEWGEAWTKLVKNSDDAGIVMFDNHGGNWGITSNGNPVWIDFSCERE